MTQEEALLCERSRHCHEASPLVQTLWRSRGLVLAGLDLVASFCAFVLAYYVRFEWAVFAPVFPFPYAETPALDPYVKMAAFTSGLWVFLLSRELAYRRGLHLSRTLAHQTRTVVVSGFYAMVFTVVVSFSVRYFLLSRLVYLMGFVLACGLMVLLRICFNRVDRCLESQDLALDRILVVGRSPAGDKLLQEVLTLNPCTRISGRLEIRGENAAHGLSETLAPALVGTAADFEKVYKETPFDELVIAGSQRENECEDASWRETLLSILNFCEAKGIPVYMVPDLLDVAVRRQDVGTLGGIPLFALRDSSLHPVYAIGKRLIDVCLSVAVILLGLPVWLAIAALIKLSGPGPVFYVQRRVGLHGVPFEMFKFRSMVQGADQKLRELVDFDALKEPVFKLPQDPRVTPLGRFLRRTSLDEIPQFINVLMGSMSIVGPRPEQIELVQRYNPSQMRRLKAKPGITGYQQVMSRADPSLARRIEYDLYYLKQQSLFLDLFIICKTVLVVLRGDGAK
jgi:exopolysaccharide biosynthesis polyprenyl glycosylphosphotransferase